MTESRQASTFRQVGLLINDIEFVPQDIVERYLPFAVPPDTKVQAVFVHAGDCPGCGSETYLEDGRYCGDCEEATPAQRRANAGL